MTHTVFIAGGTGKTGGRVADRLRQRDVAVRIGARSTGFDWTRPETWAPAIGGADSAYLTYSPDLAVPAAAGHIAQFTKIAVEQGVRRFVLLSGRGEPEAADAERELFAAAPSATVLRASWMNQNFSEGAFAPLVEAGHVTLPVGPVGEPFIDCDDIADAAVETLLAPGHDGKVYDLTGPRLLSYAEAVREIAAATGREVGFQQITPAEFGALLGSFGVPDEAVSLVLYLFATTFDGRNEHLGRGVQEILGREPRDFRDFARTLA
jgi:uncharacterized protein YbjT (DUF2867 family)